MVVLKGQLNPGLCLVWSREEATGWQGQVAGLTLRETGNLHLLVTL
jgi:hypothetical protein